MYDELARDDVISYLSFEWLLIFFILFIHIYTYFLKLFCLYIVLFHRVSTSGMIYYHNNGEVTADWCSPCCPYISVMFMAPQYLHSAACKETQTAVICLYSWKQAVVKIAVRTFHLFRHLCYNMVYLQTIVWNGHAQLLFQAWKFRGCRVWGDRVGVGVEGCTIM